MACKVLPALLCKGYSSSISTPILSTVETELSVLFSVYSTCSSVFIGLLLLLIQTLHHSLQYQLAKFPSSLLSAPKTPWVYLYWAHLIMLWNTCFIDLQWTFVFPFEPSIWTLYWYLVHPSVSWSPTAESEKCQMHIHSIFLSFKRGLLTCFLQSYIPLQAWPRNLCHREVRTPCWWGWL